VSYTVDANVLLYASDESSELQGPALAVVERLARGPEIAYLFWPTVIAYLRIATHPAIFDRPLPAAEAMRNVEQLLDRPHVQTPGEQDGFWSGYREVAADALPSGNLVSDAHLVALMRENGVRTIWTRDRDFRRFSGIDVRDPFAVDANRDP
jgi:hypothetical protein